MRIAEFIEALMMDIIDAARDKRELIAFKVKLWNNEFKPQPVEGSPYPSSYV